MNFSIVVPLYNEEKRITPFLNELLKLINLENQLKEVIFVNDGSTDKSEKKLNLFKKKSKKIKIISLRKNKGKADALKEGILISKGDYIIFIDADNSINPLQIQNMVPFFGKYDVIVGSRSHKNSKVFQPLLRKLTSSLFNPYVNFLFHTNIEDHLIGFKAFRKDIAKNIFKSIISKRWIFDVEIFFKLRKEGYTIKEIPIIWVHKDNSKMSILDPIKMALELFELRFRI